MGRPPCCDKVGIKKGPWTPEEDIILVSYIQEHGPGNWKAVPTNTGLLRCSKSCRLRWTNYLRPGIKRGNFTPHEEGMIVHLQALLGNKWAAIATYLPQRTDNDIKNYWNTHLKKKLKKLHDKSSAASSTGHSSYNYHQYQFMSSGYGERVSNNGDDNNNNNNKHESPSVYASNADNISRLLEGWMRSSSNTSNNNTTSNQLIIDENRDIGKYNVDYRHGASFGISSDDCRESVIDEEKVNFVNTIVNPAPLSFLEKWLLEESAAVGQVEGLASMF